MVEEAKVIKPRKKRKKRRVAKATPRLEKAVVVEPEKVEIQLVAEETKPFLARLFKRKKHDTPLQPKVKRVGGRRWWLAGIGLAVLVLAFYLMTLYGQDRHNFILGIMSILVLGAGGVSIYYGLKKQDTGIVFATGGKVITKIANCMNIYPNCIEFVEFPPDKLLGQPQQCYNDNKYFYVHKWKGETKELWDRMTPIEREQVGLEVFILPDTQYRDPREFANNLNIPAHRRLAQRRDASLAQKIAPFAIVAGMGIMAFLFLVIE